MSKVLSPAKGLSAIHTNGKSKQAPSMVVMAIIAIGIIGPLAVFCSISMIQSENGSPFMLFRPRADCAPSHPSVAPVPRGLAVQNSFKSEAFRLERVSVRPGTEKWRLCAPEHQPSGSKAGNPCPDADFFVVNQRDGFSDPVVDWLLQAEEHVQDLVAAVLSTKLETSCLRPTLPCLATASSFTPEERAKLVMLDIGSNHGFYGLMAAAAAPWLTVYAFEPQPHCATYIQIAVDASGFTDRMLVLNAFAGTADFAVPAKRSKATPKHVGRFVIPPKSAKTEKIPKRTGCRGTFPMMTAQEALAVHNGYGTIPGALEEVPIGYVDPSALVPPGYSVLFAKIDVEGFEEDVLDALDDLIINKKVYNILIELNKMQKLRRLNRPADVYLNDTEVFEWSVKMLQRLQDYGYTLVPQWGGFRDQQTLGTSYQQLMTLSQAGWPSVDIFAYRPRNPPKRSKSSKLRNKKEVIEEEEEEEETEVSTAEAEEEGSASDPTTESTQDTELESEVEPEPEPPTKSKSKKSSKSKTRK